MTLMESVLFLSGYAALNGNTGWHNEGTLFHNSIGLDQSVPFLVY